MLPRVTNALLAKVAPIKSGDAAGSTQGVANTSSSNNSSLNFKREKPPELAKIIKMPERGKEQSSEQQLPDKRSDQKSDQNPDQKAEPKAASANSSDPADDSQPSPEAESKPKSPLSRATAPVGEAMLSLLQWVSQNVNPFSKASGFGSYMTSMSKSKKGAKFKRGTLVDHEVE